MTVQLSCCILVSKIDLGNNVVFDLSIKQAEVAFTDGRFDEAFDLVRSGGVLEHRRGKKLAARLGKALADRGREHLDAERIEQATSDCNKAEKLNGNTAEMASLRKAICELIEQKRFAGAKRNARLAAAKDNIDNGWVSVGEQMLEGNADSGGAGAILQDAAAQRTKTDAAINRVREALSRDDVEAAVDVICQTSLKSDTNNKVAEVIWQVRSKLVAQIEENVNDGRLDTAEVLVRRLDELGSCAQSEQWLKVITLCRQVRRCIEGADPEKAVEVLGRLKLMLGKTKWVDEARSNAQKYAEMLRAIKAGPLGLVGLSGAGVTNSAAASEQKEYCSDLNADVPTPTPARAMPIEKGSRKFMMQIDGIGSYLVVCGDRVTVGPVSSSRRPDVGLVVGPDLPVVTIERTDGDYFLHSDREILLNDERVREKLLADGDRIGLSMRCRVKFKRPNAASGTAILMPSSAKFPRADMTAVVLMDNEILIGNDSTCHICSEQMETRVALVMRNGMLCCRSDRSIMVDGKAVDARQGLVMGKPIRIGRLSMVLTEVGD